MGTSDKYKLGSIKRNTTYDFWAQDSYLVPKNIDAVKVAAVISFKTLEVSHIINLCHFHRPYQLVPAGEVAPLAVFFAAALAKLVVHNPAIAVF